MLKYSLGGICAEDGDPATDYAIEAAEEYGVDLKNHKATNIRKIHLEEMDLILCATTSHKNTVLQMYPNLKDKTYTMKEYAYNNENKKDIDKIHPDTSPHRGEKIFGFKARSPF